MQVAVTFNTLDTELPFEVELLVRRSATRVFELAGDTERTEPTTGILSPATILHPCDAFAYQVEPNRLEIIYGRQAEWFMAPVARRQACRLTVDYRFELAREADRTVDGVVDVTGVDARSDLEQTRAFVCRTREQALRHQAGPLMAYAQFLGDDAAVLAQMGRIDTALADVAADGGLEGVGIRSYAQAQERLPQQIHVDGCGVHDWDRFRVAIVAQPRPGRVRLLFQALPKDREYRIGPADVDVKSALELLLGFIRAARRDGTTAAFGCVAKIRERQAGGSPSGPGSER